MIAVSNMDTMTFVSEMTKALAWPFAAVSLGLIFKGQLARLLDGVKLRRIKKGDWLADFETQAQEVRSDLPSFSPHLADARNPSATLPEDIERLISVAPVEAVLRTWNEIERKVIAAMSRAGVVQGRFPEVLRALVDKGFIEEATRDSILGLRNMRNLAVHAPVDRLNPTQAREFITMAEAVLWSMEDNLKKATKHKR
jgi:hypothetical protein